VTLQISGAWYLVLEFQSYASHMTRAVAGAGDRRFLVPQYEAGVRTGYRAAPTKMSTVNPTESAPTKNVT
jgi:hypothetical protein